MTRFFLTTASLVILATMGAAGASAANIATRRPAPSCTVPFRRRRRRAWSRRPALLPAITTSGSTVTTNTPSTRRIGRPCATRRRSR